MNTALLVVAFTVSDGFVEAKVTRGGAPVPGALIKVYDGGSGPPLVDGETGDAGNGTFVVPGDAGLVGITVDGKECDLIPLTVKGGTATPARVSLTFGTRPCCIVVKKDAPPSPPVPLGLYGVIGACVVLAVATAVLMARGPKPSRQ